MNKLSKYLIISGHEKKIKNKKYISLPSEKPRQTPLFVYDLSPYIPRRVDPLARWYVRFTQSIVWLPVFTDFPVANGLAFSRQRGGLLR